MGIVLAFALIAPVTVAIVALLLGSSGVFFASGLFAALIVGSAVLRRL
jgi:hypothetical protein